MPWIVAVQIDFYPFILGPFPDEATAQAAADASALNHQRQRNGAVLYVAEVAQTVTVPPNPPW